MFEYSADFDGKCVKVTCADGEIIKGIVIDWQAGDDDEPEYIVLMTEDCPCLEIEMPDILDIVSI